MKAAKFAVGNRLTCNNGSYAGIIGDVFRVDYNERMGTISYVMKNLHIYDKQERKYCPVRFVAKSSKPKTVTFADNYSELATEERLNSHLYVVFAKVEIVGSSVYKIGDVINAPFKTEYSVSPCVIGLNPVYRLANGEKFTQDELRTLFKATNSPIDVKVSFE